MKKYTLRNATVADRDTVASLYRSVLGSPFCTWNEEYPGAIEIDGDLAAGTLFLLCDGAAVVGVASLVPKNELDALTCWQYGAAAEIARVCIAPPRQGTGLSAVLLRLTEAELRRRGYGAVHLLVARINTPARRLYAGAGYLVRAAVSMYGNDYDACEKRL